MYYISKKWLLVISLIALLANCKSNEKQPVKESTPQYTGEQPKPGTEPQTDSLKKSLDEQRKTRTIKKEKGAD